MPGGAIFTPEQEARLREIVREELAAAVMAHGARMELADRARLEQHAVFLRSADEWAESIPDLGEGQRRCR